MKKYITTDRWKQAIKKRQARALRSQSKEGRAHARPYRTVQVSPTSPLVTINAPKVFSFILNTNAMLEFFGEIKTIARNGRRIFINFSETDAISADAIAVFLSQITSHKHTPFFGNVPKDSAARDFFSQSGVFKHVRQYRHQRLPSYQPVDTLLKRRVKLSSRKLQMV